MRVVIFIRHFHDHVRSRATDLRPTLRLQREPRDTLSWFYDESRAATRRGLGTRWNSNSPN